MYKKIFLERFNNYKNQLNQLKEKNSKDALRKLYYEARGFVYAALEFDIIETGKGENGFLKYNDELNEIYFD